MVRLVSWRDIDSGPLQVIVDDHTQHWSRVRHRHECLTRKICRINGFELSKTVVARQDHNQGLFDEKTKYYAWRLLFPSKKSCIDSSLHKGARELRRVLTRNHHVDVREFVVQDPQGFGHPGHFVSAHNPHPKPRLPATPHPAPPFAFL